jgi:hypothetical protein
MKLRDLQQRAGTAMVWPPQWVESSGPGHTSRSGRGRRAGGPSAAGQPAVAADHDHRLPAPRPTWSGTRFQPSGVSRSCCWRVSGPRSDALVIWRCPPGNGGLGDEPSSRLEGFWASGLCWASACSWAGSCEDGSASTCSGSRMNSERATARKGANDGSADRAEGSRAAGQGRGVCGLRHCDVGDCGPVQ